MLNVEKCAWMVSSCRWLKVPLPEGAGLFLAFWAGEKPAGLQGGWARGELAQGREVGMPVGDEFWEQDLPEPATSDVGVPPELRIRALARKYGLDFDKLRASLRGGVGGLSAAPSSGGVPELIAVPSDFPATAAPGGKVAAPREFGTSPTPDLRVSPSREFQAPAASTGASPALPGGGNSAQGANSEMPRRPLFAGAPRLSVEQVLGGRPRPVASAWAGPDWPKTGSALAGGGPFGLLPGLTAPADRLPGPAGMSAAPFTAGMGAGVRGAWGDAAPPRSPLSARLAAWAAPPAKASAPPPGAAATRESMALAVEPDTGAGAARTAPPAGWVAPVLPTIRPFNARPEAMAPPRRRADLQNTGAALERAYAWQKEAKANLAEEEAQLRQAYAALQVYSTPELARQLRAAATAFQAKQQQYDATLGQVEQAVRASNALLKNPRFRFEHPLLQPPPVPPVPRSLSELAGTDAGLKRSKSWIEKTGPALDAELRALKAREARLAGGNNPGEIAAYQDALAAYNQKLAEFDAVYRKHQAAAAQLDRMQQQYLRAPLTSYAADADAQLQRLRGAGPLSPEEARRVFALEGNRAYAEGLREYMQLRKLRPEALDPAALALRDGKQQEAFRSWFDAQAARKRVDQPGWATLTSWMAPFTTAALESWTPQQQRKVREIMGQADRMYPKPAELASLRPAAPQSLGSTIRLPGTPASPPPTRQGEMLSGGVPVEAQHRRAVIDAGIWSEAGLMGKKMPGYLRWAAEDHRPNELPAQIARYLSADERSYFQALRARNRFIDDQMQAAGVRFRADPLEVAADIGADILTLRTGKGLAEVLEGNAARLLQRYLPNLAAKYGTLAAVDSAEKGLRPLLIRKGVEFVVKAPALGFGAAGTQAAAQEVAAGHPERALGAFAKTGAATTLTMGLPRVLLSEPLAAAAARYGLWGKLGGASVEGGVSMSLTNVLTAYLDGERDPEKLWAQARKGGWQGAVLGPATQLAHMAYDHVKGRLSGGSGGSAAPSEGPADAGGAPRFEIGERVRVVGEGKLRGLRVAGEQNGKIVLASDDLTQFFYRQPERLARLVPAIAPGMVEPPGRGGAASGGSGPEGGSGRGGRGGPGGSGGPGAPGADPGARYGYPVRETGGSGTATASTLSKYRTVDELMPGPRGTSGSDGTGTGGRGYSSGPSGGGSTRRMPGGGPAPTRARTAPVAVPEAIAPEAVAREGQDRVPSRSVYHVLETRGVLGLLQLLNKNVPQRLVLRVVQDPQLETGAAGPAELAVELDAARIAGVPVTAPGGRTSYEVREAQPQAVRAVVASNAAQVEALKQNPVLGRLLDFGAAERTAHGIRIPRRGIEGAAAVEGQSARPAAAAARSGGAPAGTVTPAAPAPGTYPGELPAAPGRSRASAPAAAISPPEAGSYPSPELPGAALLEPRYTPPGERPQPDTARQPAPAPAPAGAVAASGESAPPRPASASSPLPPLRSPVAAAEVAAPGGVDERPPAPPGEAVTQQRYTPPGEHLQPEPDRPSTTAPANPGAVAASGPVSPKQRKYLGVPLAERLPAGTAAEYHPTTAERVPALLRAVEGGVPQGVRVPVSPTLAGQAPVVVQFAPTHVSGRPAPATFGQAVLGRYVVDKAVPGAVAGLVVRTPPALRALRANPRVARLFDFDRAEPTAGGVYVPRRGVAEAGEPAAPPAPVDGRKLVEAHYRRQSREYLEELFGRETAEEFLAGGSLPPFLSAGTGEVSEAEAQRTRRRLPSPLRGRARGGDADSRVIEPSSGEEDARAAGGESEISHEEPARSTPGRTVRGNRQKGEKTGKGKAREGRERKPRNYRLAGKAHPKTKVPFGLDMYPIFEHVGEVELPEELRGPLISDDEQMKYATRELWEEIRKDPGATSVFTDEQEAAIRAGMAKIPGYTWHHHQDGVRLQLVDEDIHRRTGHDGGRATTGGRPR